MKIRNAILNLIFFAAVFGGIYLLFNGPVGNPPKVDKDLEPYVDQWRADMDEAGLDYERGFNRIDSIVIVEYHNSGSAGHFSKANGCVSIIRAELENCGPLQLRVLIYHELGHYVFDLEHCDRCIIMNPELKSEEFYQKNWDETLNEYISQCAENEFEAKY